MATPVSFLTVGPGTLTLGDSFDASCQVTALTITPNTESGDAIDTLCGDSVGGEESTAFALTATFLQDDLRESGLTAYTWAESGQTVAFEYTPNDALAASVSGRVTIRPMPIGGSAKQRPTHDVEWPIIGTPVPTWATGM